MPRSLSKRSPLGLTASIRGHLGSLRRFLDREDVSNVLALVWISHLAMAGFLILAHLFDRGRIKHGSMLLNAALSHWDSDNYLNIAKVGYEVDWQSAFFPLLPSLIAVFNLLFGKGLYSGLVIAFLSHLGFSLILYQLVKEDEGKEVAGLAILFSLIFPAAFYFVVPYTESLFLLVLLGSYLCFRRGAYFWAGILGFLTVLSRPPGVALIPMLLMEYWYHQRKNVSLSKVLFPLLFPAAGMLFIMGINYAYHGHPLFFLKQQEKFWNKFLTLPHVGFLERWQVFRDSQSLDSITIGFNELFGGLLSVAITVYAFLRQRKAYAYFCLICMLLIVCQNVWQSSFRYCVTMFPLYIGMAHLSHRDVWMRYFLICINLMYLAVLAGHYAKGAWVQ